MQARCGRAATCWLGFSYSRRFAGLHESKPTQDVMSVGRHARRPVMSMPMREPVMVRATVPRLASS